LILSDFLKKLRRFEKSLNRVKKLLAMN